MLLCSFELLQEAGLHLPQSLGQAVSIIGGLVVGSAAVEANLVSPAALIVVAAAGICGFSLPERDFADAVRIWRFLLVIGGLMAGMAGVTLGLLTLLLHLGKLKSLGVPIYCPYPGENCRSSGRYWCAKNCARRNYPRKIDGIRGKL